MITLDDLVYAIPLAWTNETRGDDKYKGYVPEGYRTTMAAGQCIVSSLLVQRHQGGNIMGCHVTDIPHYFNELENGMWVDTTRSQFVGHKSVSSIRKVKRNPKAKGYIFDDTRERVDLLERRVEEALSWR